MSDVPIGEACRHDTYAFSNYAGTIGLGALTRMDLVVDAQGGYAYVRCKPPLKGENLQRLADASWTADASLRVNAWHLPFYAHHLLGMTKHAEGDYAGSITEQTRALEIDSENIQAYLSRAASKFMLHDLDGAAADFARVDREPQRVGPFLDRGAVRVSMGDHSGALDDFNHVLKLDPNNQFAHNNRGAVKAKSGDAAGAIQEFDRAIDLNPEDPTAYNNRGYTRQTQGDMAGALADYVRALTLNSQYTDAYFNRAMLRLNRGEYNDAIADYDRILAYAPATAAAFYLRGVARVRKEDMPRALEDWKRAEQLAPRMREIYVARGKMFHLMKRLPEAIADYSRAIELKADESQALMLYRFVLELKSGKADPGFAEVAASWKDAWPRKIGEFLTRKLSEADFLAAVQFEAGQPNALQMCQAYYYAGSMRLLVSDAVGAQQLFQKAVATGARDCDEYAFAWQELNWLEAK